MELSIDLDEVKVFIEDSKFIQFLLNNTTDINVPAFILSAVYEKIEKSKKEGTE